jgi:hypothetical protein
LKGQPIYIPETRPGRHQPAYQGAGQGLSLVMNETFEKCSILVKVKEGENFNRRNIWNISRIEI